MANRLKVFERIARAAHQFTEREPLEESTLHPFDRRNVHTALPAKTRKLFDDGHYAEATFVAFKFLDKLVQKHSNLRESGHKLMMQAFSETNPQIQLTPLKEMSEIDEQKGFQFLFGGSVWAIRNPRGHEFDLVDDVDTCLGGR